MTLSPIQRYYRRRSKWWRDQRMLFPSPAEVAFIRLLGGRVLTFGFLCRHPKTGFPAAWVLTLGHFLNSELISREVRVGKHWIDFGASTPFYKRGIEIDGDAYHSDIVAQVERDDYFISYGWDVLHIRARDVFNKREWVAAAVKRHLTK